MFCPMCGAPNEEDSLFCGNCGAVLEPEQVAAEGEAEGREIPSEAVGAEPEPDEGLQAPWPEDLPAEPLPPPPPPPPARARPSPVAAAPGAPTSGLAIASVVLGVAGVTVLPLIGSILAIIFGYMARRDIRQRPQAVSGDGLAVAGIVLGWISVGVAVVGLLAFGGITACSICGVLGSASY